MRRQLDDFGDIAAQRRQAAARARRLGHTLGKWHVRAVDPSKADAFCLTCNMIAVVNAEPDADLPAAYGHALKRRCHARQEAAHA